MTGIPKGLDWAHLASDPYPVLAHLRAVAPVWWADAMGRWLITSRAAVVEVLRRPDLFTTQDPRSPLLRTFGPQMLAVDGEEQNRHRRPFGGPFRLRQVREELGIRLASRATELLDRCGDGPLHLNPLAAEMAVGTVVDLLGLMTRDLPGVRQWYEALAACLADKQGNQGGKNGPEAEVAMQAIAELTAQARSLGSRGLLPETEQFGDLSEEEVVSNTVLILFGGIETTESMILNAAWAIGTQPGVEQGAIAADPALLSSAIEESLRWEAAVQTLTRFTTTEVELGGVRIPAGAVVECMTGGANRDPGHFARPDEFLPNRSNASDHVTFGFGRHLCLGLHLARLEAATFLQQLMARRLLVVDASRSQPPSGHEFRKPECLWLAAG